MPKYPQVEVTLSGTDSNVYMSIGLVTKALRRQVSEEAVAEFQAAVNQCEDYDDVMNLIFSTVEVS